MTKFQTLADEILKTKRKFTDEEINNILEYFNSLEYNTSECQHGGEYGRCTTNEDITIMIDKEMDYVSYTDSTLDITKDGKQLKIELFNERGRVVMAQTNFGYYFVDIDYDKGIRTTHRYKINGELTHKIERNFR